MLYDDFPEHRRVRYESSWSFLIALVGMVVFIYFVNFAIPNALGFHSRCPDTCPPVKKDTCFCGCWDGLNKGHYGRGGYKSIYFNTEKETLFLVSVFVIFCIIFVRALENVFNLLYSRQLNWLWFFCLITVVHPAFYAMWTLWNNVNDRIYHLMIHQMFFSVTEYINVYLILQNLPKSYISRSEVGYWAIFVISSIHVIQSVNDQGLQHWYGGRLHFILRDLSFLLGDLPVLFLSLWTLHQIKSWKDRIMYQKRFILFVIALIYLSIYILSNITFAG